MSVVLRVHGIPSQGVEFPEDAPHYLARFDVDAFDGRGDATLTINRDDAYVFEDAREAMDTWRSVPESRPVRGDGKPNRPLATFTVEVERVDT